MPWIASNSNLIIRLTLVNISCNHIMQSVKKKVQYLYCTVHAIPSEKILVNIGQKSFLRYKQYISIMTCWFLRVTCNMKKR